MPLPDKVWIVDDDKSIRWVLEKALQKADIETRCFANAGDFIKELAHDTPQVLITDIRMPGMDGLELLKTIQQDHPSLPVIVMTAHSDLESAVSAFHGGAFEYLPKPFDINEVVDTVQRACIHSKQQIESQATAETHEETPEIIGEAPAMQEVFRAIGRLARSHITVLINGESGTGKELVAQALHLESARCDKAFLAINCAALTPSLLESELFGHVKGAFTGAVRSHAGLFQRANGGTLFLDEVAELPLELQAKLLRVLQEQSFIPVGGDSAIHVDVRIIAATHRSLREEVKAGRFREDLMYRLRVVPIFLPPLRERRQDVNLLLWHSIEQHNRQGPRYVDSISPEAMRRLLDYRWPGNVRELKNVVEYAFAVGRGNEITLEDLPPEFREMAETSSTSKPQVQGSRKANEEELIREALIASGGHLEDAARYAGMSRATFWRKRKKYRIE